MRSVEKKVAMLQSYLDGAVDKMELECSQRTKMDDMKQNMKQLKDIMLVKFKQLEDTKEACRSMIAYQKHFHPIQTQ